jgi:hypothetical protein
VVSRAIGTGAGRGHLSGSPGSGQWAWAWCIVQGFGFDGVGLVALQEIFA